MSDELSRAIDDAYREQPILIRVSEETVMGNEPETKTVRRTWTCEVEIPATSDEQALNDGSLEDRFMEAYTQGDGQYRDEVVS